MYVRSWHKVYRDGKEYLAEGYPALTYRLVTKKKMDPGLFRVRPERLELLSVLWIH